VKQGNGLAIGKNISSNGDGAMAIGVGGANGAAYRLKNITANSLAIGFNSNLATLFVGPGTGASTYGNVGIGTSSPLRSLHISDTMRLQPRATAPSSPALGDIYVDTSEAVCVYASGAWTKIAGAGSCT
jgi:hypothetical protein